MSQLTITAPELKNIALEIGRDFTTKVFKSGGELNSQIKQIYERSMIDVLHNKFSKAFRKEKQELDLEENLKKAGDAVTAFFKEAKTFILKAVEQTPSIKTKLAAHEALKKYIDGSFLDELQNEMNKSKLKEILMGSITIYRRAGMANGYVNALQKSFQNIILKSQEFEKLFLQIHQKK